MAEPLRLLMVEDADADADLLVRTLQRSGFAPAWRRVATPVGLREALDGAAWDIVVAGHTLPACSALDAVALVRLRDPDLPVIVVSGTVDPATVVALLRAGAVDYLDAEDLTRLAPSVRRALQEASERREQRRMDIGERKRAEETLRAGEEQLRAVTMSAPIILYTADEAGTVTLATGAALSLFGVAPGTGVGRSIYEVFGLMPEMLTYIRRAYLGESHVTTIEHRGRVLEAHWWPMCDGQGRISGVSGMAVDQTDRKLAAEQQARLAAILKSVDDAIIGVAPDATIMSWNGGATRLYGWTPEEAIGQHSALIVPPGRAGDLPMLAIAQQRGAGAARFESVRLRKDGSQVEVAITVSPIRDGEGAIVGAASITRDISQRKRAEETLRASEAAFRELFAANPRPMWVYDRRTLAFLEVNEAAVAHYGYSRDEFLRLRITDIRPPEEVPRMLEAGMHRETTLRMTGEWRHRRKDGQVIDMDISAHDLSFAGHDAVLVSAVDISERKRVLAELEQARAAAEELAAERQRQAEEAVTLGQVGSILADALEPDHLYQKLLDHFARILPYDHAAVLLHQGGWATIAGSRGAVELSVGTRVFPIGNLEVVLAMGNEGRPALIRDTAEIDWIAVPPFTGARAIRSVLVVPLVVDGEVVGTFNVDSFTPGFYSDRHLALATLLGERVTQALRNARLYQAEQARGRAAEELARARTDFVAAVSHELRTPLTAVLGYSELLLGRWESIGDAGRRAYIERIASAAARQQRLVEDLLLAGQIEAGAISNRAVLVRVADLVRQASEEVQASYRGQRIDAHGQGDLVAMADPARTVQVLVNLLDNAAKYSPEGSPIAVTWRAEAGAVVVRVRDRGAGIPETGRPQLFTRFGRLPDSRIRAGHVGTGLGLHLGRELARAMDGELDLEETGSEGSTFRLRLPPAPGD